MPLRTVAVGDLNVTPLANGADTGAIDGVLGTDVLRWFAVDLDAPDGQMTLYRAEPCWVAAPPWPGPAVQLAGVRVTRHSLEFPRRLLLPIELDGVSSLALLDTGSQSSAVTLALADRVGVSEKALKADPSIVLSGVGPEAVTVPLHRFRSIRVGNWVADDPVLPVLDLPHEIEQRPEVTGSALAGAGRAGFPAWPPALVLIGGMAGFCFAAGGCRPVSKVECGRR